MRLWVLASAVLVLMTGGCTTASAQEGSEGAENFVRAVYASYSTDPDATPPMFGDSHDIWSDRMSALIARDQELANDELPYLDADPICNCQDWENLTVHDVRITQPRDGRGGRLARVHFTNAGSEETTLLRLSGNPNQGWKIDDILYGEDEQSSLAGALAESNARIEAGGRALGRE